jgi:hypothetical protein
LLFGERRLRSCRDILKRDDIPARMVNVTSILEGELAENEVRNDFTPSERVAIGKAIEELIGNRRGQRDQLPLVGNLPQVEPGPGRTPAPARRCRRCSSCTPCRRARRCGLSGGTTRAVRSCTTSWDITKTYGSTDQAATMKFSMAVRSSWRREPRWVYRTGPTVDGMARKGKADVSGLCQN